MKKLKKNSGITLIALIITIVILIILASVAITLSLGDNGIFKKAAKAKEDTLVAQNEESVELAKTTNQIDETIAGTREQITIEKQQYEKLLQDVEDLKSNSAKFIDTSRKIACVGQSSDWCTTSYSYTATEDCAILGRAGSNNGGYQYIYINDINVGLIRNGTGYGYSSVNYYIKKGDTIKFNHSGTGSIYLSAYAYGLK